MRTRKGGRGASRGLHKDNLAGNSNKREEDQGQHRFGHCRGMNGRACMAPAREEVW